MSKKLIIALDYSDPKAAKDFLKHVDPSLCMVKVGLELFCSAGKDFVQELVESGYSVFLDLKFHDIPNTVAKACKAVAKLGISMLTVHACGGLEMLKAAKEALDESDKKPLIVAVTALTSMNQDDFQAIGLTSFSITTYVANFAQLAYLAKLDGVVCAAGEVPVIKSAFGKGFLTVTPGIRLAGDKSHDQKRVLTPKEAIELGSDYLVIGRSITNAKDPSLALKSIFSDIA